MIESILFFLTAIAILVLVSGVYLRNAIVFGVGGIILLGIGAYLLFSADPINTGMVTSISTDAAGLDYNLSYLSLTPATDNLTNILANFFFYGGFALAVLSIAFIYITRKRKVDAYEEAEE
jgi:hypothetical protein